jgi:phosphoribosylformylglycinamidine cyclo-ligase
VEIEYVKNGKKISEKIEAAKLVLSPTRTYLPVMKKIFSAMKNDIHGMIHCTGGGQTKVLKL